MIGAHALAASPLLLAAIDALVLFAAAAALWSVERSFPRGRALAAIAATVLALGVARVAFAPMPNIQPVTVAMLLIGVHLGARRGFAIGVGAAYASNLVLGAGMFAPFQALGWGLCAVVAHHVKGRLLGEDGIRIDRLCVAGAIAALGFDLFVSLYALASLGSLPAFAAYLAIGIPYDLLHVVGNVAIAAWGGAWMSDLLESRVASEISSASDLAVIDGPTPSETATRA